MTDFDFYLSVETCNSVEQRKYSSVTIRVLNQRIKKDEKKYEKENKAKKQRKKIYKAYMTNANR